MIEKRSIEELLEVAKLEEVVGQFVTLGVRGANRKADACPFCQAKKKFNVNIPKQIYKCFECGEGGNGPLKFLMKRGMEYRPAIVWLADYYKFILREVESDAAESGDTFDTSYYMERMEAIGYSADTPETKGLFRARSDGGIEIRYPQLYTGESPWQQHAGAEFVRTRLHPTKVSEKGKYNQPSGTGIRIFIPPVVVAEWRAQVKWEALYVVEGEFKAFAAARPGVPVVAIGGINLYMDKKGSHNLHADLVQLLRNAQAVCLVHDADATAVRWDPSTEPDKDLGKRPRDFAKAVTGFRRSVGTAVPKVIYSYIHTKWMEKAKGLDDLIAIEGAEAVVERLTAHRTNGYFTTYDITKEEWRGINGIFSLNMHGGVPKAFHREHTDVLGESVFNFLGGKYQYKRSEDGEGALELLEHPDSKQYVAVGCDFYKRVMHRDHNHKVSERLELWKESNLQRNYVRNGVPRFLHTLPTYDGFIVQPGHHEEYVPEVVVQLEEFGPRSRYLNKYRELDQKPASGKYPVIEGFLKHIFGTEIVETKNKKGEVLAQSEAWQVYLDRWTIMYRWPQQRVPAVVLASEERNTGKSTVLDLNMAMWGGNGVIIGNDAIASQFNANWIDCSFVGINEAMLKRREDGEKLKDLMTSPVTQKRGMYREGEQSTNFTKFDITTNSPDKFLEISDDEFRYWVNVVKPFEGEEDPDMLKKMIAEIPALFHDLRTREVIHPRMGRLWFANSVIDNEARRNAAVESASWCEKDVKSWIQECFYEYRWPELYYSTRQVRNGVNENNGTKYRGSEVTEVLTKRMKIYERFGYATIPIIAENRNLDGVSSKRVGEKKKGRWFVFRAVDYLPHDLAKEFMEEARADWAISLNSMDGTGAEVDFEIQHPVPQFPKA